MIDWPLAVGLIAFAALCGLLLWIERQAEDERLHEPHRDLVVHVDDSEASEGRVRFP